MADWKALLRRVLLADGQVDSAEVEILREELLADGEVDADEAGFLVALRTEARSPTDAFETFFFEAMSKHLLQDGELDASEAAMLREALFADGKIDEREKAFLRDLKNKARKTSPEFDRLYDECMKR